MRLVFGDLGLIVGDGLGGLDAIRALRGIEWVTFDGFREMRAILGGRFVD